ncbi:hypothetical protein ANN_22294 [Periplaneta americana]|uniref:Uncharacterized protein n=1 Tax=Periplaneta americana TaxID=6978 RepID=A0ABQ8S8D5_PERAM|nr:hypothetical protein ANN_22294 [Periplaneta americana]
MAGLCEGGNEPSGFLKVITTRAFLYPPPPSEQHPLSLLRAPHRCIEYELIAQPQCLVIRAKVILTDQVDDLQSYNHELHMTAKNFNFEISVNKTKVQAFVGKYLKRIKIVLSDAPVEQFREATGVAQSAKGDNAGEMSPGSSTESYPAFARIGLRENPGKNLNQVTCPDRESNPGHLVSQPNALTVTPQLTPFKTIPQGFHTSLPTMMQALNTIGCVRLVYCTPTTRKSQGNETKRGDAVNEC